MKKIYLILSLISILFLSCESDFDVNAEWEEVTVVYGLLDAGKELQQIKISKAFLGEMDALQMAQYADSINFNKGELEVKIVQVSNNGSTDTIILNENQIIRDGGGFNDTIMVYTFNNINGWLDKKYNYYELIITNKQTGKTVRSITDVISNFSFDNIRDNYKFGFYNDLEPIDSLKYKSKLVQWNSSSYAEIYQLDMVFHYLENGQQKSLIWSQPLVAKEPLESLIEGEKFFNFLRNNISKDNSKTRNFISVELIMTLGTEDLETYINVNQPASGIVQQRPQFTNIDNGIGLFSSRYTFVRQDIDLASGTLEYILDNDKLDRNFE